MRRRIPMAVACLYLGGLATAAPIEFRTERVVVFKDGYTLVAQRGTARADERGTVYTGSVPDAVLGTVWARTADGRSAVLKAEMLETTRVVEREDPASTIEGLLRAGEGRAVELLLSTGEGERRRAQGTIIGVLPRDPEARDATSRVIPLETDVTESARAFSDASPFSARYNTFTPAPERQATIVMLQDGSSTVAVPISDIQRVIAGDLPTTVKRRSVETRTEKRLTFDFGSQMADKEVEVEFYYFAQGMRWIPTYRLTGDLEKSGTLSLQGELLNELVDLEGARVELVAGVPSFEFRDLVSPLSLERELRRRIPESNRGPLMSQAFMNSNVAIMDGGGSTPSTGVALPFDGEQGAGAQDLFVYTVDNLTLARGGRATLPLWSSSVPLQHVYTAGWSLTAGNDRPVPLDEATPAAAGANTVWHKLDLANGTANSWTTGPALVMQDNLPIAQSMIRYTARGASMLLPLTIATDVQANLDEEETALQANALNANNESFSLSTRKGVIRLRNYRSEPSTIDLRLQVEGDVTAEDAKAAAMPDRTDPRSGRRAVNKLVNLHWKIELKPGETREVPFSRKVYIR